MNLVTRRRVVRRLATSLVGTIGAAVSMTLNGAPASAERALPPTSDAINTNAAETLTGTMADINGDGRRDLITRIANGDATVHHGLGGDGFAAPKLIAHNWNIYTAINFADINGDGRPDLITRIANGDATVKHGLGGDGFAAPKLIAHNWNIYTAIP
jgi:hypothetical protein